MRQNQLPVIDLDPDKTATFDPHIWIGKGNIYPTIELTREGKASFDHLKQNGTKLDEAMKLFVKHRGKGAPSAEEEYGVKMNDSPIVIYCTSLYFRPVLLYNVGVSSFSGWLRVKSSEIRRK